MDIAFGYQMKEMDSITINNYGVSGIVLMENASMAVAQKCMEYLKKTGGKKAVFVCGTGNNGGDGFAAARILSANGFESNIILVGNSEKLKGDALINFKAAVNIGIEVFDISKADYIIKKVDLVIDAIFGTGFSGEPRDIYKTAIEKINNSKKYIISVDIASGVNSDTGHAADTCVKADETVSFCMAKVGNILYPGAEKCGKLTIANISIPQQVKNKFKTIKAIDTNMAEYLIPKRMPRSNKGTYGKLFVIAGSYSMGGAACLSAKAAYKTGCGVVYSVVPKECLQTVQNIVPEAVAKPVVSLEGKFCENSFNKIQDDLKQADTVVIGPGLGTGENVNAFVEKALKNIDCQTVIDADALNAIAENTGILREMKNVPIITPHPGEMSRLTGKSVKEVIDDTIKTALEFSKEYNTIVVLKDARTIITSPNGEIYINMTGNNAMSKGGSGDVLSGIIGALKCVMNDPLMAAVLGVYIHGLCGDMAAEKLGSYGVLARDLCDNIAHVMKYLGTVKKG